MHAARSQPPVVFLEAAHALGLRLLDARALLRLSLHHHELGVGRDARSYEGNSQVRGQRLALGQQPERRILGHVECGADGVVQVADRGLVVKGELAGASPQLDREGGRHFRCSGRSPRSVVLVLRQKRYYAIVKLCASSVLETGIHKLYTNKKHLRITFTRAHRSF